MTELKQVRVPDLAAMKSRGEKIAMLTAYDATMAALFDQAGVDVLLVGDSLGNVILGYADTLEVTMDDMVRHTRAVRRGTQRALVAADMPFLSYQASTADAVRNAGRLLQEGGAAAVKLEGGMPVVETVARLVSVGIPVIGHLGLLPQSVHQLGGFRRPADTKEVGDILMRDAEALENAGACSIVLECVPDHLAADVSARLRIPTIGIGSGPRCDGQVLVSYDLLGLTAKSPSFVKRYAQLGTAVTDAVKSYVDDIKKNA
jgi:3-methyl-2-oxobutanoate hydroxymethyltransferase